METVTDWPSNDARSHDATVALLRDRRRRHAIAVLSEREPPIGLRELASAIATREAETESDASTATTDAIAASLHHAHLPKLDAADVVDYDGRTVTAARVDSLAGVLEMLEDAR